LVGDGDLSVEIHGASGKAALFRRVFDRDVLLRACPARVAARRSSSARATLRRPVPRPVPRRA
jgi:hypothetical protein